MGDSKINMDSKKVELLRPIITAFGEKSQMLKSIEEMSELQKAICKYLESPSVDNLANITEEMADVSIMIDQLLIIFSNGEEMQKIVANKIDRTYIRLGLDKDGKKENGNK